MWDGSIVGCDCPQEQCDLLLVMFSEHTQGQTSERVSSLSGLLSKEEVKDVP